MVENTAHDVALIEARRQAKHSGHALSFVPGTRPMDTPALQPQVHSQQQQQQQQLLLLQQPIIQLIQLQPPFN